MNVKFCNELVMAERDMATLRAFFERHLKYTKVWDEINNSLVHLENVLDIMDVDEGATFIDADSDDDE